MRKRTAHQKRQKPAGGSATRRWRASTALAAFAAMLCAGPALASAPGAQTIMVTRNDGILEIVGNADPVVKGVMALLIVASIASWALWVLKAGQLRAAKTALRRDIAVLASATSLKGIGDVGDRATVEMLKVAAAELALGGDTPSHRMLEGIEERVAVQLPIVEARAIHHMLAGTNLLGSIGSIAPFVGLAGTVWGIVNSFLSIARSHATSLAVVAPGIAEALIATAMGLAAAIPAVLIYNSLSRSIAGYRRMLSEVSVLVACVLSREAERRDVVEYGGVSSLEARRIGGRSGGVAASSEAGR